MKYIKHYNEYYVESKYRFKKKSSIGLWNAFGNALLIVIVKFCSLN